MAQVSQTFRKDPGAELDYHIDWSDWLASGETITASAWTVPTGIDEIDDSARPTTFGDTSTVIWLSGGEAGEEYLLTNRITTSDDRTDDRTICFRLENR